MEEKGRLKEWRKCGELEGRESGGVLGPGVGANLSIWKLPPRLPPSQERPAQ